MSTSNLPTSAPSLERFIQRVKSAEKSQQRDIRITIQEARDMVSDIALFTTRLNETLNNINKTLSNMQESTTTVDVKMDGGGF